MRTRPPPGSPTLTLLLIRHADAGDREIWSGSDRLRPLSTIGREQAGRIAALWQDQPLTRVMASPYARCTQTVEPMAAGHGLVVEATDALAEGCAWDALALIQELVAQDTALCTHGDIVPAVLHWLDQQGADVVGQWRWQKGSTWVLHTQDGTFTRATHVPRPQ